MKNGLGGQFRGTSQKRGGQRKPTLLGAILVGPFLIATVLAIAFFASRTTELHQHGDGFDKTDRVRQVVVRDEFERANSDLLGSALTGQPWGRTGSALPVIRDGRIVSSGTGSAYALVDVGRRPLELAVTASWNQAVGDARSGVTMISSDDASFSLRRMVHFNLRPTGWVFQVGDGGALTDLAYGALALETDGTPYTWSMRLVGQTATLTLPNGTERIVTNPHIEQYTGAYCIYEIGSYPGSADSRIDAVAVWSGSR